MTKFSFLTILLAVTGAGCLTQPPASPPPSPSASVQTEPIANVAQSAVASIQNFAFSPKTITVKKGANIVFTNKDGVAHTVTADTGEFESGNLSQNQSFTLDTTKLAAGAYNFHCAPHPYMTATLIVE